MRLIPKADLRLDGWTYGDWTQYVAFIGRDSAQCCRRAYLPTILSMIGVVLFAVMIVSMMAFGPLSAAGLALLWLAGACQALIFVEVATRSLWCVMVGPRCPRNDDGGFYRLFPGEADHER